MKTTLFIGGAGTGKTTQLIQSALAQVDAGIETLLVPYNPLLVEAARAQVLRLCGAVPDTLHILTLPQLSYSLLTRFYKELGYTEAPRSCSAKEGRDIKERVVRDVGAKLFPTEDGYAHEIRERYRDVLHQENKVGYHDLSDEITRGLEHNAIKLELSRYQAVFVDDVQDIFAEEWQLLRHWQERLNPQMALGGDINSAIASGRGAKPQELTKLLKEARQSYQISRSHRCKPWICTFASQLVDHNNFKSFGSLVSALQSRMTSQLYYVPVTTEEHQQNQVVRQIVECLDASPDVTIGVGLRTPEEGELYSQLLREQGVEHQLLRLRNRLEEQPIIPTRVYLGTAQELKGLEFTVMVIPNCVDGAWPHAREYDPEECRRQFYVLVTRAQIVCYFIAPQRSNLLQVTTPSKLLREGNTPDITVHGLPA